jgi:hypothetical protein
MFNFICVDTNSRKRKDSVIDREHIRADSIACIISDPIYAEPNKQAAVYPVQGELISVLNTIDDLVERLNAVLLPEHRFIMLSRLMPPYYDKKFTQAAVAPSFIQRISEYRDLYIFHLVNPKAPEIHVLHDGVPWKELSCFAFDKKLVLDK